MEVANRLSMGSSCNHLLFLLTALASQSLGGDITKSAVSPLARSLCGTAEIEARQTHLLCSRETSTFLGVFLVGRQISCGVREVAVPLVWPALTPRTSLVRGTCTHRSKNMPYPRIIWLRFAVTCSYHSPKGHLHWVTENGAARSSLHSCFVS